MATRASAVRRLFRSRRGRRRALISSVGIIVPVTAGLVVGLMSASAAGTNGDPILWAQTQCIASLGGGSTTLVQNQDITVQAVVPNDAATSQAYSATIPGGTANLPSSSNGLTITGFKDIAQTYLFRSNAGSPQITGITANGGATSNGNPVAFNVSSTNEGSSSTITGITYSNLGGGVLTYTTAAPHNLAKNQTVDIVGNGNARLNFVAGLVGSVPSTTTFTVNGHNIPPTGAVWDSANGGEITYFTNIPHGFEVGDRVTTYGWSPSRYNRSATITAVPTDKSFVVPGGATDPGAPTVMGYIDSLGNPGSIGSNFGTVDTLTTATLSTPNAAPGALTTPDVTVDLTAPSVDSTVTTYGAVVTTTATVAPPYGDTPTVCSLPHADPQTDGISATLVGTGGPTTTSYPTCRPPDVCATTTTTLPPAPTVTGINPTSGTTAGGTSVTISGTNLTGATAVNFGATAAASFTVDNDSQITATSPAASAGTVDVTVTTPSGTSATGPSDQFTFVSGPSVSGVSPTSGPAAGGTSVTISGSGFTGATDVNFGATAAAGFTVDNDGQITATSPAHAAGTVDITVTTPSGTSATGASDQFTFVAAPSVSSVSPTSGPAAGGTSVTISGSGFTGATDVSFGATAAAGFTVDNDGQITATSPAHAAGTVDITVTGPGGTSTTGASDQFTFVAAPAVTSVSPTSGSTAGGDAVTISGSGFTGATDVSFGATAAASFTVDNDGQITATSPAHAAGTVDITVTTAGGTSATGASDQFTFVAPPSVSSVNPTSGTTAGGDSVTISGSGFTGATAVAFGGTPAASFTVDNDGQITATSPAHSSGTVDIFVTTPYGVSSAGAGDEFTFNEPVTGCTSKCVSVGDTSMLETDAKTHTMLFPVTLSERSTQQVTVDYTVTDGSATGGTKPGTGADYKIKSGTLVFKVGNSGLTGITKAIAIPVFGDTTTGEGDETLTVHLSNPTGGFSLGRSSGTGDCAGQQGCGTGVILDDDGITSGLTFGIGDTAIVDATGGNQAIKFRVTMSNVAATNVTVNYTVIPGTATYSQKASLGGDYGGKQSGTLLFKPGATVKNIAVKLWPEAANANDQTFTVVLSGINGNGTTVTVIRDTGTGTIMGLLGP